MLRELSKVEQRYDAVLATIGDSSSVSEGAEARGASRQTVPARLARYRAGGSTRSPLTSNMVIVRVAPWS